MTRTSHFRLVCEATPVKAYWVDVSWHEDELYLASPTQRSPSWPWIAPKIGRIPLPDIDSPVPLKLSLDVAASYADDEAHSSSGYTSSPETPIEQRRLFSRSSTPPKNPFRSSSQTPELVLQNPYTNPGLDEPHSDGLVATPAGHVSYDTAHPMYMVMQRNTSLGNDNAYDELDYRGAALGSGRHATRVVLRCRQLSQWPDIVVPNSWTGSPSGVICSDVINGIHSMLYTPLTAAEREQLVDTEEKQQSVEKAFRERCSSLAGLSGDKRDAEGWRRVDLLGRRHHFVGLRSIPGERETWEMLFEEYS